MEYTGIKAKKSGTDLFDHEKLVYDLAKLFNSCGNYGISEKLLEYFSIFHDLGKACDLWQSNMETNNYSDVCRHEICSILFCNAIPEEYRDDVVKCILSHHRSINDSNDYRSFYQLWDNDYDCLISNHVNTIGEWGPKVKAYLKDKWDIECEVPTIDECKDIIEKYADMCKKIPMGYSIARGLCMVADRFASCYDYIFDNTTVDDELKNANNIHARERISNMVLNNLFKDVDTSFYAGKNEKYPLSLIDSDDTKKHSIVIAPTGSGKTNFMMKQCHKRIFYILPFQASNNAMYQRINRDLKGKYAMALKHSGTKGLSFINKNSQILGQFPGIPIKVMTSFQIFDILFRNKGYEINILDLYGQDVILDEVHTYQDKTLTAVLDLIRVLVDLNCRIHICTATIPSNLYNQILGILGKENTQEVKLSDEDLDSFNRHIMHCKDFYIDEVIDSYNKGEKVLIIRNTVKRARKIYAELKEKLPGAKMLLLHSKFRRFDKANIEKKLMEYNSSSEPCIVVSTQVVEVSLDISFDIMFTDIADIMSLIQRFGRVNRVRVIGLLKHIYISNNEPMCYLPYDKGDCDRTYAELMKYDGKVLPEKDIQAIIDRVHPTYQGSRSDFSPYFIKKDGEKIWKSQMYCHVMNKTLADSFNFDGFVGILASDKDRYVDSVTHTKNTSLEIPISKSYTKKASPVYASNGEDIEYYLIDDSLYDEETGLNVD